VEYIPPKGYDLVLAGGLFDYLTDKMITRLLAYVWNDLQAPGGSIFFTNVAPEYKADFHAEAIGNWSLIGRSDDELHKLCGQAGIPKDCVTTMYESTGITIMVTCRKPIDDTNVLQ
jgi:extracellular factor (EF) 3-hydroxypalmitic acid methyl ester biosynthesis protein